MSSKKQFVLNLLTQIAALASQVIISLFLTPFVLERLGAEAYGFVGLVNNFVSYTAVATTALNSLASRFITLAFHKGKRDESKIYYSSVFFANCILASVVLGVSIILAMNIERIVNVSSLLVVDLRLTVLVAFANAGVGLVGVVFGVAAFIKNKLYLNSVAQLLSSVLRTAVICALFLTLPAHMWYYSVAGISATLLMLVIQVQVTKTILPEFFIQVSDFRLSKVVEIIKSGIWSSLESLNKVLQVGLDLFIANLFVGAYGMGLLSVSKTVPLALASVAQSVSSIFYPRLTEAYATGDRKLLLSGFNFAMRFTAMVLIVPLVGLVVYGQTFYQLWLPERVDGEVAIIQFLSILTVISLFGSAYVEPIYYANVLANKIKVSVLISLVFSVASLVIELFLLVFTSLEPLCVVAATSSLLMAVRHCLIQPLYCAYVLGIPYGTFFSPLLKELCATVVAVVLFSLIQALFPVDTWLCFIAQCSVSAIFAYPLLSFFLLYREERSSICQFVRQKFSDRKISKLTKVNKE